MTTGDLDRAFCNAPPSSNSTPRALIASMMLCESAAMVGYIRVDSENEVVVLYPKRDIARNASSGCTMNARSENAPTARNKRRHMLAANSTDSEVMVRIP